MVLNIFICYITFMCLISFTNTEDAVEISMVVTNRISAKQKNELKCVNKDKKTEYYFRKGQKFRIQIEADFNIERISASYEYELTNFTEQNLKTLNNGSIRNDSFEFAKEYYKKRIISDVLSVSNTSFGRYRYKCVAEISQHNKNSTCEIPIYIIEIWIEGLKSARIVENNYLYEYYKGEYIDIQWKPFLEAGNTHSLLYDIDYTGNNQSWSIQNNRAASYLQDEHNNTKFTFTLKNSVSNSTITNRSLTFLQKYNEDMQNYYSSTPFSKRLSEEGLSTPPELIQNGTKKILEKIDQTLSSSCSGNVTMEPEAIPDGDNAKIKIYNFTSAMLNKELKIICNFSKTFSDASKYLIHKDNNGKEISKNKTQKNSSCVSKTILLSSKNDRDNITCLLDTPKQSLPDVTVLKILTLVYDPPASSECTDTPKKTPSTSSPPRDIKDKLPLLVAIPTALLLLFSFSFCAIKIIKRRKLQTTTKISSTLSYNSLHNTEANPSALNVDSVYSDPTDTINLEPNYASVGFSPLKIGDTSYSEPYIQKNADVYAQPIPKSERHQMVDKELYTQVLPKNEREANKNKITYANTSEPYAEIIPKSKRNKEFKEKDSKSKNSNVPKSTKNCKTMDSKKKAKNFDATSMPNPKTVSKVKSNLDKTEGNYANTETIENEKNAALLEPSALARTIPKSALNGINKIADTDYANTEYMEDKDNSLYYQQLPDNNNKEDKFEYSYVQKDNHEILRKELGAKLDAKNQPNYTNVKNKTYANTKYANGFSNEEYTEPAYCELEGLVNKIGDQKVS